MRRDMRRDTRALHTTAGQTGDDSSHPLAIVSQAHASDRRVSYQSAKYPWIESVSKFKGIKPTDDKNGFPKQFDTTRFEVPARAGVGKRCAPYECVNVPTTPRGGAGVIECSTAQLIRININ